MSLMSKVDVLKAKAEQDEANELDLMRAALVESQERYNQQSAKISLLLEKLSSFLDVLLVVFVLSLSCSSFFARSWVRVET